MPTIPEAIALAIQHHRAGRFQTAEQVYRQILKVKPEQADAWHLLGVLNSQLGRQEVATDYIRRAIQLNGNAAAFHRNLGAVLDSQGQRDEAVACYRRALELKPDFAQAHSNLGNALNSQGKLDEAVACHRRALVLKPDFAEAHSNLGTVLKAQGQLDEALACYERALELKPDYAPAHNNLGIILNSQGKLNEAVACYRRALELKPDYPEAHNNLGIVLKDQGQLDEALACYERALELKPDYAPAHWNRSLLWLLVGDLEQGWPEYEWRWQRMESPVRPFRQPMWSGEPLDGKTILLHAEGGLGDTIQFIRYAPLVRQRGARVIAECPKALTRLLSGFPGIDDLVVTGATIPDCDVQAPLMSLPGIFQTTLATIPADVPYLQAAPELVERWRAELRSLSGLKVGICWQGNPRYKADRDRSFPLSCLEPLGAWPGLHLISLQKGPGCDQLRAVGGRFLVHDLGTCLDESSGPFMDTAAVMMNLDLVISADTAVAHLAGALGVPVWLALTFIPHWPWLLERDDSPWYPTMRLFRQRKLGDWASVFAEMLWAAEKTAAEKRRSEAAGRY